MSIRQLMCIFPFVKKMVDLWNWRKREWPLVHKSEGIMRTEFKLLTKYWNPHMGGFL